MGKTRLHNRKARDFVRRMKKQQAKDGSLIPGEGKDKGRGKIVPPTASCEADSEARRSVAIDSWSKCAP